MNIKGEKLTFLKDLLKDVVDASRILPKAQIPIEETQYTNRKYHRDYSDSSGWKNLLSCLLDKRFHDVIRKWFHNHR